MRVAPTWVALRTLRPQDTSAQRHFGTYRPRADLGWVTHMGGWLMRQLLSERAYLE